MNNKENYKKAMNNVKASEELKDDTFKKVKIKPKKNFSFTKFLSACAVFAIILGAGGMFYNNHNVFELAKVDTTKSNKTPENQLDSDEDFPRFENIEELKKVLAKNSYSYSKNYLNDGIVFEAMDASAANDSASISQSEQTKSYGDYSTTNVQVENVDEADIVKTDGKYIYYVKNSIVFIVDSSNLNIVNKLSFDEDDNDFVPKEVFIKDDKMVVLGTSYIYDEDDEDDDYYDTRNYIRSNSSKDTVTEAIVMDISKKENPKEERRVALDGSYNNARMIDDNLYFISNKYAYYYKEMDDEDILPVYKDSVVGKEFNNIPAERIAHFRGTKTYSYMLVAGFNVTKKEEAKIETIFGASNLVYASTDNLYVVQDKYSSSGTRKSVIYKFSLDDGAIKLKAKGTVKGYMNNQFSMDEYEGKLRVATTAYVAGMTKNQVYILDENLEQIGSLRNMAIDEKIYSVRFIGKIGYVVTFEQIDPLFVLDLSDPTNPQIKGELKIPGYSSYLHPYDETHIIGIGYNTETTKYGSTVNKNMKMSMFDVSDLSNPKEMFSIDIGKDYASSEIINNHKALFYNKDKNLIGFPVSYRENNYSTYKDGFTIFKIDLNKGFEVYGDLTDKMDYKNHPERIIYIKDELFAIFSNEIDAFDLNTLEKKNTVSLK